MGDAQTRQSILDGKACLGIELGSTRIKLVLTGEDFSPIASGGYEWQNTLLDGVWTYSLDDVWIGLRSGFRQLSEEVRARYGVPLTKPAAIGVSAMMHGYLVFDGDGNQLVPFRTWRNTMTAQAASELTAALGFGIPQRWSAAHLYQAILNGESHVRDIAFLTTLAGYVHWRLTGEKALGVGDASGVFPVDSETNDYHAGMLRRFEALCAGALGRSPTEILPRVLKAGKPAGMLTEEGARLLDPSGELLPGVPMCPPEGDAGTGMVATNSVATRTGNISAGTSIFAMVVLEKPLAKPHPEIDMVTTPAGNPVAMVHSNSCTSDLDAWVKLFREVIGLSGASMEKPALYDALYEAALFGEPDCGGLLSYNYYAGETMTGCDVGRPLFVRTPESRFTLANFMRMHLFSAMGTLRLGMDILEREQVRIDRLLGHGGLFKTEGVGQRLMAAAMGVPIRVMKSAGEGGAWGIALLAAYLAYAEKYPELEVFLSQKVFPSDTGVSVAPDEQDVRGFTVYMERYKEGLAIERAATKHLRAEL